MNDSYYIANSSLNQLFQEIERDSFTQYNFRIYK